MTIFADQKRFFAFTKAMAEIVAKQYFVQDGDYFVEEVVSDIKMNLVGWAVHQNTIFYVTEKFLYGCTLQTRGACCGLITIIQVPRNREGALVKCSWMNQHSCSFGKEWLQKWSEYRVALY